MCTVFVNQWVASGDDDDDDDDDDVELYVLECRLTY